MSACLSSWQRNSLLQGFGNLFVGFWPMESKIKEVEEAVQQVHQWQQAGEKIVFTNGCFDVLHVGHTDYLQAAAELGQRLVVGLNADASVSRLKGPNRPINPEQARARVLAALAAVDAVVLFAEDTPLQLITALQPDVLVKGGDYAPEAIVGADVVKQKGGKVLTIPLTEGFSTTSILQKGKS